MTEQLPSRENGYLITPDMQRSAAVLNAALGDLHERMTEREALEASFESLIAEGTSAALSMIAVNVAPQLVALQEDIAEASDQIAALLDGGSAPDALKLGGQLPAYYLDLVNMTGTLDDARLSFLMSADGKALVAALSHAAMRGLLEVYSSSETDAAIVSAIDALVDGAPGTLDTLNELAAALADNDSFAATITAALAGKAATGHVHAAVVAGGASGFMTGADKTRLNAVGTMANRTLTISTADPSGGVDGDVWFKV
ncbi:hypothetical protein DFR52_106227 [Hoeflea marina]|uniref:Uncharacterized protein n=1 Tax=Hoeflea marina TaxID=274592 RepID=A0A317PFK6_9HYPH|nr:hypothetical protein [Hoeflea marina]PWV97702.1 hypothetical protein DFR52_106227 [Hoeflea marina]